MLCAVRMPGGLAPARDPRVSIGATRQASRNHGTSDCLQTDSLFSHHAE